jgi:glycyl-tRNA synthetase
MDVMEKIVSLCKRRGFVFPGSEIYGGVGGIYDLGPLGVELANNIKKVWWKKIVYERDDVVGLDSSILMNRKVWHASGHTESFADPLVECKNCHSRFRQDILPHSGNCPVCGKNDWTPPRMFNLMFKTHIGPIEDEASETFLRPETAQGIFVNFLNVVDTMRVKLPFGIAQIGKGFRNEITIGNFLFRVREFEMAELEYFVKPSQAEKFFNYWCQERMQWFLDLGISKKNLRFREHEDKERAHYAVRSVDIEYNWPFGSWLELEGIANRTDFDLRQHSRESKKDLSYLDEETKEKIIPYVIEPSLGIGRAMLAFLIEAYHEDGERVILRLNPKLAPYKVAVFPLLANKPNLVKKAESIYQDLKTNLQYPIVWDDRGNIGKRYYSQDEIGTPFCITVDFQSLEDETVTVRDRDTTKQVREKIARLSGVLKERLG